MQFLINEGTNMSIQLDNGETPMHLAAEKGNKFHGNILKYRQIHTFPNKCSLNIEKGSLNIINLLLNIGVSPYILNGNNSTPLHNAAKNGN